RPRMHNGCSGTRPPRPPPAHDLHLRQAIVRSFSPQDVVVKKKTLLDVAKYLLAIGLLVWVVKSNWAPPPPPGAPEGTPSYGLGYVWEKHVQQGQPINPTNIAYLAAGFVVFCAAVGLGLYRWYLLVRALDLEISVRDAFRYGMIGIFFNNFLPGGVGGDLIK